MVYDKIREALLGMKDKDNKSINKLPTKIRLSCIKHGCRLRFDKKFGGYICTDKFEGSYCVVVRVLNLQ